MSRPGRAASWSNLALAGALFVVALVAQAPTLSRPLYFNDVETTNLPLRVFMADGWRAGEMRYWAPELGAGFPVYAEGQAGPAYPPNLLFAVVQPSWLAFSWSVILHLFWAGLGAALCCRQHGTGRLAAFCGGVIFMLAAPVHQRIIHLNFLHGLAWLPWLLWCLERGARGQRWGWTGAGVCLGLQFLAGHNHPAFLGVVLLLLVGPVRAAMVRHPDHRGFAQILGIVAGLLVLLVAAVKVPGGSWLLLPGGYGAWYSLRRVCDRPERVAFARALGGLAGALALGMALGAPQVLPLFELVGQTPRESGLSLAAATEMSLLPGGLRTLLLPRLHGSPFVDDLAFKLRWGTAVQWEWNAYVGVLPLALLLLAPWLGRRRERWVFLALAVVAVLLAMGKTFPFYGWLWRLPGWHGVRGPARFLPLFALATSLVAGLTLDDLLRLGLPAARRWFNLSLLATVAVVCAAAVVMSRSAAGALEPAHAAGYVASWIRAALLVVAAAAVLLTRAAADRRVRAWAAAAAVLIVFDAGSGSVGLQPLEQPDYYAPPPVVERVRSVAQERVLVPVYEPHPLETQRHMLYPEVHNLAVYTPLHLARATRVETLLSRPLEPDDLVARRWLALLRVEYTLARRASEAEAAHLMATGVRLYPRAWVTPRWRQAESEAAAWELASHEDWRPEIYSIVEATVPPPPRRGEIGEVLWSEFGRHRITCRVTGGSAKALVLSQTAYPGWRVRDGDRWRPALRMDYLLLGTMVDPGVRRIDFVFDPISVRLGHLLGLLGLAFLAGYAVAARAEGGR